MTSTITTARLAAIGTRLAAVAATIAPLIERMDARDREIAALAAGIRARDWTIGETPRPTGGTYDGSVNETRAKREAMYAQRAELEALQASDRATLRALSNERAALVNERAALELELAEAGEPADLTDDIELASSALSDLQAKRATCETAIADALAREADAQADIDAEAAAIKVLEAARADNYLKPSDTNAGSADDAELAASDARHKAAGARAALPRLAAKTQQARDKLVAHDAAIEVAQDELDAVHERQRQGQAHVARNAVRRAGGRPGRRCGRSAGCRPGRRRSTAAGVGRRLGHVRP